MPEMLSSKLGLNDVGADGVAGKKVLMRVDFNVPLSPELQVTDETRIKAALPTVKQILDWGCSQLVLMSHLGRPDGRPQAKYSLKPVADVVSKLLGQEVVFVSNCVPSWSDGEKRIEETT